MEGDAEGVGVREGVLLAVAVCERVADALTLDVWLGVFEAVAVREGDDPWLSVTVDMAEGEAVCDGVGLIADAEAELLAVVLPVRVLVAVDEDETVDDALRLALAEGVMDAIIELESERDPVLDAEDVAVCVRVPVADVEDVPECEGVFGEVAELDAVALCEGVTEGVAVRVEVCVGDEVRVHEGVIDAVCELLDVDVCVAETLEVAVVV